MAQMTFLDFFSGIGGAARALSCVGHCEINKYADRDY